MTRNRNRQVAMLPVWYWEQGGDQYVGYPVTQSLYERKVPNLLQQNRCQCPFYPTPSPSFYAVVSDILL